MQAGTTYQYRLIAVTPGGITTTRGPHSFTAGSSGFSILDHYYQNILNRDADAGGKSFWQSEVSRMNGLGSDPKETYIAMARYFFTSPEFIGRNLDDDGYVRNLYATFFNRVADQGGLDYWKGVLASGLPRDMVMYAFMFSPEFAARVQAVAAQGCTTLMQ